MSEIFASATAPAVSIVVPVRNEADNIAPLVDEIAAALDKDLARPHASGIDSADGEPSVAATDQA